MKTEPLPKNDSERAPAVPRDVTEWKRSEELLRALAEGTAGVTGREFFRSLARHAAKALAVRYAFLAECLAGDRARGVLFFMAAARGAYGHLRCGLVEQVASAVAAALDDCLAHEELRRQSSQALTRSEERLRDLFDEAPIAYVHEGLDTRFIQANRAAMRSLGIKPEEVAGTYGKSFIPDTPEAQRRLREALEAIGGGTYTRTMFLDITDRVLMEREKARLEAQNTYLQEEIRNKEHLVSSAAPGGSTGRSLEDVERRHIEAVLAQTNWLIEGERGAARILNPNPSTLRGRMKNLGIKRPDRVSQQRG